MKEGHARIAIRPLQPSDGSACYDMRRRAFLDVFSRHLDEQSTAAGADAYELSQFSRMLTDMVTSVAVESGVPVGFCTVRRLDDREAELLWLYVRLDRLKRGIGSKLARHAEELARARFPGVADIVLVTAVPGYNQSFYERLGYRRAGEETVRYPAAEVPVVRLRKRLRVGGRRAT